MALSLLKNHDKTSKGHQILTHSKHDLPPATQVPALDVEMPSPGALSEIKSSLPNSIQPCTYVRSYQHFIQLKGMLASIEATKEIWS